MTIWLLRLGVWIARWGGYRDCEHPGWVPEADLEAALVAVERGASREAALTMQVGEARSKLIGAESQLVTLRQDRDAVRALAERALADVAASDARYQALMQVQERLVVDVTRAVEAHVAAKATLAATDERVARERAEAVAGAAEERYVTLARAHERQTREITQIVAERDQARADFQQYAQQRLDVRPDLRLRAEYLVGLLARKGQHLSGEFKRHQVYADLLKEFPDTPKRDLSMAIEMAVRAKA